MPKRTPNRFAGILQPRLVGAGSPEVSVLVLYDIENDKIRNRISDVCLNYGLERIQYSAFLGKINRNQRQQLTLQLQDEVGDELARIRVIPITEDAVAEMWILDQFTRVATEALTTSTEPSGSAAKSTNSKPIPKLRIIGPSA